METADHHAFFGAAGVGKVAIAYIDANMIDFSPELFSGIEKDQISISEFGQRDGFSAFGLVDCSSGKPEVHRGITIISESGAVEAIGSLSRITIRIPISPPECLLQRRAGRGLVFDDRFVSLLGSTSCQEDKNQYSAEEYYRSSKCYGTAFLGILLPGFHGVVRQVLVVFIGVILPEQVI